MAMSDYDFKTKMFDWYMDMHMAREFSRPRWRQMEKYRRNHFYLATSSNVN